MTGTMRPVKTYADYLNTPPDTDVTVEVTVEAGTLHVGGVDYGPGDTFMFTGPRRVPRSWERSGHATVAVPKPRRKKKKAD